jgi:hypothetical protein
LLKADSDAISGHDDAYFEAFFRGACAERRLAIHHHRRHDHGGLATRRAGRRDDRAARPAESQALTEVRSLGNQPGDELWTRWHAACG